MLMQFAAICQRRAFGVVLGLAAATAGAPLAAQGIQTVDPDAAIDGDLASPQPSAGPTYEIPAQSTPTPSPTPYPYEDPQGDLPLPPADAPVPPATPASPAVPGQAGVAAASDTTYKEDDLIGAAEGLFGKGAEGLARLIQDILAKQGEPNAYIVGREGGGAFIVGVRYGSGTLYHKVEGQRPVYWTGPSIGLDAGANAGNTFVLVYNLYDTEELYERFPAGEGQAYFVGGFNVSYMRKGDTVLIPIRVGAGLRLGVNAGYMKFSKEQRWLPF